MQDPPSIVTPTSYRPDIDGLRALAVLLVIFCHVEIHRFAGGFVGVDVFFVISGYLISSLVLKEIDAGRFSIFRFYERRFRRIVPALVVVLAVTTVFAYRFLFPPELNSFAQSEVGALFSFSNIVFWKQTGYFSVPGKLAPLLHTWSLGVEEQFYIVFPVLMLAICRWFRPYLKVILWTLTLPLFVLAWYWLRFDPTAAFYLAPLRAWEFLIGILVALKAVPALRTPASRNFASALGLLGILVPALIYTAQTRFPATAALPPCIGAALILAAGQGGSSAVGSLLSLRLIRWIGLLSYSLYLWHWPLQVFQTTNRLLVPDRYPSWVSKLAVIAVSFPLAALSWRFVEQPFRTGCLRRRRIPLFAINGALMLGLLLFCNLLTKNNGWAPFWLPKTIARTDYEAAVTGADYVHAAACYVGPSGFQANYKPSVCLAPKPGVKNYLLLGNSHAAAVYPGLAAVPDWNTMQLNVTYCAPTVKQNPWIMPSCQEVSDYTYRYLAQHHVDAVLLASRWQDWDLDNLGATVQWIQQHGMQPVVLGPSIEFDQNLVRLIEIARRDNDPGVLMRHRDLLPQQMDIRMAALARDRWHIPYISMYQDLCNPQHPQPLAAQDPDGCPVVTTEGVSLLVDTDHLSPSGAVQFAQQIKARHQLP